MTTQKCTLTGTLKGSGDTALTGYIRVTLDAPIIAQSTTPDTLLLGKFQDFTVTAGVVNLSLWESETDRVTYHFQFFEGVSATSYFDYHVVVPNTPTYEFSQLLPTGIVTDRLATGALRVGKAILSDPLLTTDLKKVLGIYRQTTVPTATADGDVWINPAQGLTYSWNATVGQWLSQPYPVKVEIVGATATTATVSSVIAPYALGGTDAGSNGASGTMFLAEVDVRWNVTAGPLTTSNRWDISYGYRLDSQVSQTQLGSTINTFSSGVAVANLGRSGVVLSNQRFNAATLEFWGLTVTKVGSPGSINASATFMVRFGYPR
jgi:hypothetical protein